MSATQSEFSHFIITRIGLGIYDEGRLNKIIDLFAAVTLPSLVLQTKQDFVWLIVTDAASPIACKRKIADLIAGHKNYHCIPIDMTSILHVRLAAFDWVWDRCQSFILERRLIASPEDYVVTSIIDADDAWNLETVATVHRLVVDKMPTAFQRQITRGTWLRHSVGLTITFLDGYVWFISARKFWPLKMEFRSMSVFVVARFSSGISACSCRHTQWRMYSEILEFEVISLSSKEPMWIYSRHDEAVESWNARQGMQIPPTFEERLEHIFGVDRTRIDQWLLEYPADELVEKKFNPSAAEQYDLMFRIAARNRQIRTLEMAGDSTATETSALLSQARSEREKLIRKLQEGSASA